MLAGRDEQWQPSLAQARFSLYRICLDARIMKMPDSTVDGMERPDFDEKKAYVAQEEKGTAFVLPPTSL